MANCSRRHMQYIDDLPMTPAKRGVDEADADWNGDDFSWNETDFVRHNPIVAKPKWVTAGGNIRDSSIQRTLTCLPPNGRIDKHRYQCWMCSKIFSRRSTLWNHKKTHSPIRCYGCSLCGRRFKWKNSLEAHARVHLKKKEIASLDEIPDLKKLLPRGIFGNQRKRSFLFSVKNTPEEMRQMPSADQENATMPSSALGCRGMNYQAPVQCTWKYLDETNFEYRHPPANCAENKPSDFVHNYEANGRAERAAVAFDQSYFDSIVGDGDDTFEDTFLCDGETQDDIGYANDIADSDDIQYCYADEQVPNCDNDAAYLFEIRDETVYLPGEMYYSNETEETENYVNYLYTSYDPEANVTSGDNDQLYSSELDDVVYVEDETEYANETDDVGIVNPCHYYYPLDNYSQADCCYQYYESGAVADNESGGESNLPPFAE